MASPVGQLYWEAMWSAWLDTALRVAAWAFAAGGVLVLLWALLWNRSRGRQRCPRCWYAVGSVPVQEDGKRICPECGRSWKPKQLLRTRRRWRWALASLVLFGVGYAMSVTPDVRQAGWIGAAPTSGLIWWIGRYPAEQATAGALTSSVTDELVRRIEAARLRDWQWRWLLHEVEFVRAHEKWPRGRPLEISLGFPDWLMPTLWFGFDAESPLLRGSTPPSPDHSLSWTVGELPTDATSFTFTVKTRYWSGMWRIPVAQVASADEAIEAADDPRVVEAIDRHLRVGILEGDIQSGYTHMLGARLFRSMAPALDGIAVGLVVELRRDGKTVQSWDLIMQDGAGGDGTDWVRFNPPKPMWNKDDPADMTRWSIRVRGSADVALRDLARERYWRGEFEGPLAAFLW